MYMEREIEMRDHSTVTVAYEFDTDIETRVLFVSEWRVTVAYNEDGSVMTPFELGSYQDTLTELDSEYICVKLIELYLAGN